MSDDPRVTVPAELVERLRYVMENEVGSATVDTVLARAARALLDAAERPDDGEAERLIEGPPGYGPIKVKVPVRHQPCLQCGSTEGLHTCPPPVPVSDEAPEDEPISADHLRKAVLQWASRFIPGDRWDTEDVRDLETALGGTVENRCHHRSFDAPVSDKAEADPEAFEFEAPKWAAAWDEGHTAGTRDMTRVIGWGVDNMQGKPPEKTANPFRAARQAGKDEQP